MRDIIAKKRDGRELTSEEIRRAVNEYTSGGVAEAEMAALLMAICLRGMVPRETLDLTQAMADSGERLDLSSIPGTKVDKHSSGGVGDKTTLVVAPLVAACGVPVPKMSGRALGHTGGTIDKLECIPGLVTDLAPDRFCRQVSEIGVAVAAQSDRMAPADKRIYALRDVTATVESIALIASSIMSKKLAVGADAIVLDVKAGGGAFMRGVEQAQELAKAMVEIATGAGMKAVALVTRMDEPLGCAVGDAVEMMEAIATLAGEGLPDFVELCQIVAGHMLALGGACSDPEEGQQLARRRLVDGQGLEKLREMVRCQGGDGGVIDDPQALIRGAEPTPVAASRDGVVVSIDARRVGVAIRDLKSAARDRKRVCGAVLHKKVGHTVTHGEAIATVLAPAGLGDAVRQGAEELAASIILGEDAIRPGPLIGVIEK